MSSSSIEPYTIHVEEDKLQKLKQKLELAEFPDELDEAGWAYGSPLADIKRLTQYWKNDFDWRKAETKLNALPQFHTAIPVEGFETLDIHFVHQRSNVAGAIPLLFVHGWKSPFQFNEMLQLTVCQGQEASSRCPR
jgi:hypothetical protein